MTVQNFIYTFLNKKWGFSYEMFIIRVDTSLPKSFCRMSWHQAISVYQHLGRIPLPNAGDFWRLVIPLSWIALRQIRKDLLGATC
jgi:hypothetical protein